MNVMDIFSCSPMTLHFRQNVLIVHVADWPTNQTNVIASQWDTECLEAHLEDVINWRSEALFLFFPSMFLHTLILDCQEAGISAADSRGRTALHVAAAERELKMVKVEAEVNRQDRTPLQDTVSILKTCWIHRSGCSEGCWRMFYNRQLRQRFQLRIRSQVDIINALISIHGGYYSNG